MVMPYTRRLWRNRFAARLTSQSLTPGWYPWLSLGLPPYQATCIMPPYQAGYRDILNEINATVSHAKAPCSSCDAKALYPADVL
jgi:hypothetical protein